MKPLIRHTYSVRSVSFPQLSPLRSPQFRRLYAGQLVSQLGDQMTIIALPFAVLAVTGSATGVGLVLAAALLPKVAFLLLGGVIADRVSRRRTMLAADLTRFGCQAAMAALLFSGDARLWPMMLIQAVSGTASAAFLPASSGLLPQLLPRDELQPANALFGLSRAGGIIVASSLSGALVAAFGARWCLAFDSVSFLISAAFLSRLRLEGESGTVSLTGIGADLRGGWREVAGRRWLWSYIGWTALVNVLAIAPLQVLGPLTAARYLGGAAAWGTIAATSGVGVFFGVLLAMHYQPRRPLLAAIATLAFIAPELLLLAIRAPVPAIAAVAIFTGASFVLNNVLWSSLLQRQIPLEVMSRVTAYDWFASLTFLPLGMALIGPASSLFGLSRILAFGACFLVVSSLAMIAVFGRDTEAELALPAEASS